MKLSQNKTYIILLFISWQLLFFIALSGPNLFLIKKNIGLEVDISINFDFNLWLKGVICGIVAFFLNLTSSLFIEFKIILVSSFKKYIWKVLGILFINVFVYSLLIWEILNISHLQTLDKGYTELSLEKIYNILYFFVFNTISFFIFLMSKIYLQLKSSQLKQLRLEANLKESQLNTLKGQINPHFMFNSLNNIRGLILEDTEKSREMITRLSEMLRYSLTKNDMNSIAIVDELEMVDNYIAISKIQMEERLTFEKNILLDTEEILIPPMIIQMLVENAVKHGIAKIKKGGTISLNIKKLSDNLLIEVINPGKLNDNSSSTKLGVKNIKERLTLLYKKNAFFNLKEKNNLVIATIQIPLS